MSAATPEELRPGDRVTYRGMRGLVLAYGWQRDGEWHHGPYAPVLCQDSVTRMLRPADVEVEISTSKKTPPAAGLPRSRGRRA